MAEVIRSIGRGGQRWAESHLGWCRTTIRKGLEELNSGHRIVDRYNARGRKRAEFYLVDLNNDIRTIVDPTTQADPTFRSVRIYSPLNAGEVRRRLIREKGYKDAELPSVRTIRNKLNELGNRPSTV